MAQSSCGLSKIPMRAKPSSSECWPITGLYQMFTNTGCIVGGRFLARAILHSAYCVLSSYHAPKFTDI